MNPVQYCDQLAWHSNCIYSLFLKQRDILTPSKGGAMKYSKALVTGATIIGSSVGATAEEEVILKDLKKFGIDHFQVSEVFNFQTGVNLNPNETIRMIRDEEGKYIQFETLDHHSVIVPIELAAGPFNKRTAREGHLK